MWDAYFTKARFYSQHKIWEKVSKDLVSIGHDAELEADSGCLDFFDAKKNLCMLYVISQNCFTFKTNKSLVTKAAKKKLHFMHNKKDQITRFRFLFNILSTKTCSLDAIFYLSYRILWFRYFARPNNQRNVLEEAI